MHTHKLVRIIEGLECYNLSDLISSYDYEKFILLQKFNPNGVKIPANCKALSLLPLTPLLLVLLIKTPTTYSQHRKDNIKFPLFNRFSVENTKTPISSTRSKTQRLFCRQLPKASATMIMRNLQVF